MKRAALVLGALSVCLTLGAFAYLEAVAPGTPKPGNSEVLPGVHAITSGGSVVYAIKGADGYVLVNAGGDESAAPILKFLEQRDASSKSVRAILVTSPIREHWEGVQAFEKAVVYASKGDVKILDHARRGRALLGKLRERFVGRPPRPNQIYVVLPGERLELAGLRFDASPFPGVTSGATAYRLDGKAHFVGAAIAGADPGPVPLHRLWVEEPRALARSLAALDPAVPTLTSWTREPVTVYRPSEPGE